MSETIHSLLAVLGLLWVVLSLVLAGVMIWSIAVECSERTAARRHSCADCETVDASTAYLNYRCMRCGRRRPLGIAWHVGTNRKRRRPA
jgi:hypothetical protein